MNLRILFFFSIFVFIQPQIFKNGENAGIKVSLLPNQLNAVKNVWYQYFVDHVNNQPINNLTSQGYKLSNAQLTLLDVNPDDISLTLGNESIFVRAQNVKLNANFDIKKGNIDLQNVSLTSTDDLILMEIKVYLVNNSDPLFYLRNITLTLNNIIVKPNNRNLRMNADRKLYVALTNLLLRHLQLSINTALKSLTAMNQNQFKIPATPLTLDVHNLIAPKIDANKLTYFLNGSSFVTNQEGLGQNVGVGNFPDYDPNATQGYQVFIGDDVLNSALFGFWASNNMAINIGNLGEANPQKSQPATNNTENTEAQQTEAEAQQTEAQQTEAQQTEANQPEPAATNNESNANNSESVPPAVNLLRKQERVKHGGIATFNYSIILSNGTIISNNETITIPIKIPTPPSRNNQTVPTQNNQTQPPSQAEASQEGAQGGAGGAGQNNEANQEQPQGNNEAAPVEVNATAAVSNTTMPLNQTDYIDVSIETVGNNTEVPQNQEANQNNTETPAGTGSGEGGAGGTGVIIPGGAGGAGTQNQEATPTQNEAQQNQTTEAGAGTEAEAGATGAGAGAGAGAEAGSTEQSQEAQTETSPPFEQTPTRVPITPYALIPPVDMTTDLIDAVIPGLNAAYGPGNSVLFNCYYVDALPPVLNSNQGAISGKFNGSCQIFVKKQDNWYLALVINALADVSSVVQFSGPNSLNYAINVNNLSNLTTSNSAIGNVDNNTIESNINNLLLGGGPFTTNLNLPLQNLGQVSNPLILIQQGYVQVLADIIPLPLSQ